MILDPANCCFHMSNRSLGRFLLVRGYPCHLLTDVGHLEQKWIYLTLFAGCHECQLVLFRRASTYHQMRQLVFLHLFDKVLLPVPRTQQSVFLCDSNAIQR